MVQSSSTSSSSSSSSSAAPGCYVTLKVSQAVRTDQGYRISVTVIDALCLPLELFVFQRKPGSIDGTQLRDEFSHVASPADLEEYPVGEPFEESVFYRESVVELIFRDVDLLRKALRDLKSDVCNLVESINQMDKVSECEFTVDKDGVSPCLPIPEPEPPVPPTPPVPSSSSSSPSSSSGEPGGVLVWGGSVWGGGAVWGP